MRHCEERSDEAIQLACALDCFASLAMTVNQMQTALIAHQERVAASPAGLDIPACEHVGDTVVDPVVALQMLDRNRARPQGFRCVAEETDQHAILIALDVDL